MFKNEKSPFMAKRPARRRAMVALLAAWMGMNPMAASAESAFPNRAVKLVVPYAAGGGTDAFARLLAQALGKQVGQTVIVDNRPGAGGLLAGGVVAQSAPDGYTLVIDQSSIATQPILYPSAAFDVRRDVTPVILGATLNNVMLVTPNFPAHTVQELITLVRSNPGKFNYASTGNGTPQHLAMEIFMDKTGLKVQHVPYKGGSPGLLPLARARCRCFSSVSRPRCHLSNRAGCAPWPTAASPALHCYLTCQRLANPACRTSRLLAGSVYSRR